MTHLLSSPREAMHDCQEVMKACPWCGAYEFDFEVGKTAVTNPQYFVVCKKCKMAGPHEWNTAAAVVSWNTLPRAESAPGKKESW